MSGRDAVVARLTEHLRRRQLAGDDVEQVGPFLASFDRDSSMPFRNYAVPDPRAEPAPDDVDALVAAFACRQRQPRVEWLVESAPCVEATLRAAGFVEERRTPAMLLELPPDGCMEPVAEQAVAWVSLHVVSPTAAVDVAAACVVAHLGFEEEGMPDQHDIGRLVASLGAGGGAVLARRLEGGEPVGTARYTVPAAGVAEVVGVAVLRDHRRRGIAASMLSAITEMARRRGVDWLWLTPDDEAAGRVYEAAGFRAVAEALHMSRPA